MWAVKSKKKIKIQKQNLQFHLRMIKIIIYGDKKIESNNK